VYEGERIAQLAGVFERAEQSVTRGRMVGRELAGAAKQRDCIGWLPRGHLIERMIQQGIRIGICVVRHKVSIERE
jgi:hypothetical protein